MGVIAASSGLWSRDMLAQTDVITPVAPRPEVDQFKKAQEILHVKYEVSARSRYLGRQGHYGNGSEDGAGAGGHRAPRALRNSKRRRPYAVDGFATSRLMSLGEGSSGVR